MRKSGVLVSFAALVGFTGIVHADGFGRRCMIEQHADFLTINAFMANAIEHNYRVRSVEAKAGCAKIRASEKNGGEAELFVDLSSGDSVQRDN
jgi:hypothetical protein